MIMWRNWRVVVLLLLGLSICTPVVVRYLRNANSTGTNASRKVKIFENVGSSPSRLTHGFEWIIVDLDLEDVTLRVTDDVAMLERFVLRYLRRIRITCPKSARFGNAADGGWDVCLAGPFNISIPCLVYSFGISGDWTFDDYLTTTYQCQDMAFDPSIGKSDHKRNPLLWFFNTGLGAADSVNRQNWTLRSFPSLLALNKHTKTTVDILKMDIEYAEWESLETMLKAPDCLRNVKQFMWEFHLRETWRGQSSNASDFVRYWNIARGLDRLGFKIWKVWDNHVWCDLPSSHINMTQCFCANVYYINVNFFR